MSRKITAESGGEFVKAILVIFGPLAFVMLTSKRLKDHQVVKWLLFVGAVIWMLWIFWFYAISYSFANLGHNSLGFLSPFEPDNSVGTSPGPTSENKIPENQILKFQ